MDLGYTLKTVVTSLFNIMSRRISFVFFGNYYSLSLLTIFIGVLLLSLSVVLIHKIFER